TLLASRPPAVNGISQHQQLHGSATPLTIRGSHLSGVTQVRFGTTIVTDVTHVSDSMLNVVAPAGGQGRVHVAVAAGTGISAPTAKDTFSFLPVTTSLSTKQGPVAGGTVVKIGGFNLTGASGVMFGSQP